MQGILYEDSWEDYFQRQLDTEKLLSSTPISEVLEIVIEAEVPVPDHLRNRSKELSSLRQLKLSQKIGILLYLSGLGCYFPGVRERLQFYLKIATLEAIESSRNFSDRLRKENRVLEGVKHVCYYYLSTNFHARERRVFRKTRFRGYRDKGTLPDIHLRARNRAQEENFMSILALEESTQEFLKENLPEYLFEGDFLDLRGVTEFLETERLLLDRLERILLSKG